MDRTAAAATFVAVADMPGIPSAEILTSGGDTAASLRSLCGPLAAGCAPMPWPAGVWLTAPGPPAARAALAHPDVSKLEDRAIALQIATTSAAVDHVAALVAAALAGDTRSAAAYAGMLAAASAARRSSWFALMDRTALRARGGPPDSQRPAGLGNLLGRVLTAAQSASEAGLTDREADLYAAGEIDRFLAELHAGVLVDDVVADLADFGWLALQDPDVAIRDAASQALTRMRRGTGPPPAVPRSVLVVLRADPMTELAALALACCPFAVSPWDRTVAVLVPQPAVRSLLAPDPTARAWDHPPLFSRPLVCPPRFTGAVG